MKVVLFCGGQGMRIREGGESIPKPLVTIGYRPIIWHLMKYYAHYGHKDFILCLGYKADAVKSYFRNYDECLSNDFTLSNGGKSLELLSSDIQDWKITFVDTGLSSNIGQRLMAVRKHLDGEKAFLANYSDGLTDMNLSEQIDDFQSHGKVASFLCVKPTASFHVVEVNGEGVVEDIQDLSRSGIVMNGGFFVFRREIFDSMKPGEELVREPFRRLIAKKELRAYRYGGFFACMDTYKEKQILEDFYTRGEAPWEVWKPKSDIAPVR